MDIEIKINSETVDTYKVSDNTLTMNDITSLLYSNAYCGGQTAYYDNILEPLSGFADKKELAEGITNPFTATVYTDIPTYTYWYLHFESEQAPTHAEGVPLKIVYLYSTSGFPVVVTSNNINYFRLVTQLDMKHVVNIIPADCEGYKDNNYDASKVTFNGYNGTEYRASEKANLINVSDKMYYCADPIDQVDDVLNCDKVSLLVHPYVILKYKEGYVLMQIDVFAGYNINASVNYSQPNAFGNITLSDGTSISLAKSNFTETYKHAKYSEFTDITSFLMYGTTNDGKYGVYWWNNSNSTFSMSYAPSTLESYLDLHKICGSYVYADKIYKPVITDGYVSELTDDLTRTSEFDAFNGTMGHNVPDTRPSPHTDTDGIDDMEFDNNVSFVGGMVDYYIATAGNVDTISDGITADTQHIGISDNIVSLMAYRVNPSRFASGSMATSVECGKLNISTGNIVKITALTPVVELGSIAVTGKHGTLSNPHFLDMSPYSKYDLYIPFCGTIELPSRIVYNTIHVYLIGDIITGSCLGVVKCNGEIVGVKSGIIGRSVPMTYNASAEQHYAMLNGVMNGIGAGTGIALAGATNNISGIVSGTMSGISNISQQIQAGNSNYTHTIGVTGSICEGSMPEQCYLRRYSPKDLSDSTFTTVYGRPLCKNKTLSSGAGFTIVDNAVISGTMTQVERTAIVNMFKTGVIL